MMKFIFKIRPSPSMSGIGVCCALQLLLGQQMFKPGAVACTAFSRSLTWHELVPRAEGTAAAWSASCLFAQMCRWRELGQGFRRGPFGRAPQKKPVSKWHFLESDILGAALSNPCLIPAGELLSLSQVWAC